MNATEFLTRPRKMEKQMERIEEELAALVESVTESRLFIPAGKYREASMTPMDDALVAREELKEVLNRRMKEWRCVSRETADVLEKAFGWRYLTEKYALKLRYLQGCSWEDTAKYLCCCTRSAHRICNRGLKMLQQYLDERKKGGVE